MQSDSHRPKSHMYLRAPREREKGSQVTLFILSSSSLTPFTHSPMLLRKYSRPMRLLSLSLFFSGPTRLARAFILIYSTLTRFDACEPPAAIQSRFSLLISLAASVYIYIYRAAACIYIYGLRCWAFLDVARLTRHAQTL